MYSSSNTTDRLLPNCGSSDCLWCEVPTGLKVIGGTDLFRLTESEDAPAVYEKLGGNQHLAQVECCASANLLIRRANSRR